MKNDKINFNDLIISFLFGAILILVPLIVHLSVVNVSSAEYGVIRGSKTYNDIFIYCRSCTLIVLTVIILLMSAFEFLAELGRKTVDIKSSAFFAVVCYGGFAVLSTLFSSYKHVAVFGITERYEGLITLICYIALFLVVMFFVKSVKKLNFFIICIFIGTFIIGLIGLGQFMGFDIFKTELAAKLIYGSYYKPGNTLNARFDNIYSVLYNPNYVGSFFALTTPIFAVIALLLPVKNKFKYFSLVLTAIGIVNIIGSGSAGALLGVLVSAVICIIVGLVCGIKNGVFKKIGKGAYGLFALLLVVIIGVGAFIVKTDSFSITKVGVIFDTLTGKTEQTSPYYWKDIKTEGDRAIITTAQGDIEISMENGMPVLAVKGEKLEYTSVTNEINVDNFNYNVFSLASSKVFMSNDIIYFEAFDGLTTTDFLFKLTDSGMVGVTKMGEEYPLDTNVKAMGFEGLELLGSGRGYIWSRTLPLIFRIKTFLFGAGPDTFALEFPQNDILGKTRFLGNPYVIVDKPHNLYLQTAVNTGALSLIAFVVLMAIYLISTVRKMMKSENTYLNIVRLGLFAGVLAYLAAGMACDSTVAVAPYFWIILGLGCGLNRAELSEE